MFSTWPTPGSPLSMFVNKGRPLLLDGGCDQLIVWDLTLTGRGGGEEEPKCRHVSACLDLDPLFPPTTRIANDCGASSSSSSFEIRSDFKKRGRGKIVSLGFV
ncbi:hypothetical protein CEXT_171531 [Caerostris extrusa]|uniref:Uncharacterized protein n=1 Tax=Caerostris extrusa TaxID=172846 RepID=A0AAV4QXH8_CAEEX|nr:hypothetical protein CEXT_171531 [Caerostris extrusa]